MSYYRDLGRPQAQFSSVRSVVELGSWFLVQAVKQEEENTLLVIKRDPSMKGMVLTLRRV